MRRADALERLGGLAAARALAPQLAAARDFLRAGAVLEQGQRPTAAGLQPDTVRQVAEDVVGRAEAAYVDGVRVLENLQVFQDVNDVVGFGGGAGGAP